MYPTCAYDTEIIHIFLATGLHQSRQHLDEDEFLTVRRIPVEKAVQMVLDGEIPVSYTHLLGDRFEKVYSAAERRAMAKMGRR